MKKILSVILASASLLLSMLISSCDIPTPARDGKTRSWYFYDYFDTVCELRDLSGEGEAKFGERRDAVEAELSLCNKLFDIYHTYEGIINLKSINDAAGNGAWLAVDSRIIELLTLSKEIYTLTDGNMNVLMGSVLSIWHDARTLEGEDDEYYLPDMDALRAAAEHTAISSLEIDADGGRVRITDPGASLDVGAVAKGYAAQRVEEMLRAGGLSAFMLDFGGNIVVGEKLNGDGTSVAVRNPSATGGAYARVINIKNCALVTSGVDQRFFEYCGVRYHHIIDKDTLMPKNDYLSVSVCIESSAMADALSTALFNMSVEDGQRIASILGNVELTYVFPNGEVLVVSSEC